MTTDARPSFRAYPTMPLYVRDWLAGRAVRTMTSEQRGAFLMLLLDAWPTSDENLASPCTIPDNDDDLAILSGLGAERWAAAGAKVKAQFQPAGDGRLRNPKQWAVYCDLLERSAKLSTAGRKGMDARWRQHREQQEQEDAPAAPETPAPEYAEAFALTWACYPSRSAGNPKKAAFKAWRARIAEGIDPADLHRATEHYAAHVRASGKEHTEFVMQGATFYGPNERWREFLEPASSKPRPRADTPRSIYMPGIDDR